MDSSLFIRFILLICLLLLSGFFSGSETAFFSINKHQTRKFEASNKLSCQWAYLLLKNPKGLIITLLIGNELVNVSISVIVTSIMVFYGNIYLAVITSATLLLFFGEVLPKTVGVIYPERFSLAAAIPLRLFYKLVKPVRRGLAVFVDFVGGLIGFQSKELGYAITEDEFKTLVNMGHDEGVLEVEEKELIHKVFDFGDTKVSEVMTPRTDIFSLSIEEELEELFPKIKKTMFSRVPVYQDNLDTVIGILYIKDLLSTFRKDVNEIRGFKLKKLLHSPYFVPETKKVSELLKEFQANKIHMAIVMDEYGGLSGLVTMEDLLEELVGEITDEFDEEESLIKKIAKNRYRVSAMMPVDKFNEELDSKIESEDFDTIGGFVFQLFGKLPKKGDVIRFEDFTFKIDKMKGRRILGLEVERRD